MDEPSPDLFIDAAFAYLKTAAVKAAVALDLFTAIAQEDGNLERIAARTGASTRGVRILCDYLTVQGFLSKNDNAYILHALHAGIPDHHVSGLDALWLPQYGLRIEVVP